MIVNVAKIELHSWQSKAIASYLKAQKRIYSTVACPGSGKSLFALLVAKKLYRRKEINSVVVIVHTAFLRFQWQKIATAMGFSLSESIGKNCFTVLTHQQYASNEKLREEIVDWTKKGKLLLVSDEHHHLADGKTWGRAMLETFSDSQRILILSGTLFRHDDGVIPFVKYDTEGVSLVDYEYGYEEALKDGVVSPIYFPVYGGKTEWQHGTEGSIASFGDSMSAIALSRQLNTAIQSDGWLKVVVEESVQRLKTIQQSHPAAAGLFIARDLEHSRYCAQLLKSVTGKEPILAVSDEPQAHSSIEEFAKDRSNNDWIVTIRMLAEGVDIPRLRVGVFASNITTELFFRQLVGRLIRVGDRGCRTKNYLYLPAHPLLLQYARSFAQERKHVLDSYKSERQKTTYKEPELFVPIGASAFSLPTIVPNTEGEHIDKNFYLSRLDRIIAEATALKVELGAFMEEIDGCQPFALIDKDKEVSISFTEDKKVHSLLMAVAKHQQIEGLSLEQLLVLCSLKSRELTENICHLQLHGLVKELKLSPLAFEKYPNLKNTAIATKEELIGFWLPKLSSYEQSLLSALLVLNRSVSLRDIANSLSVSVATLSKKHYQNARNNLIRLRLVTETKKGSYKLYRINPLFDASPISY